MRAERPVRAQACGRERGPGGPAPLHLSAPYQPCAAGAAAVLPRRRAQGRGAQQAQRTWGDASGASRGSLRAGLRLPAGGCWTRGAATCRHSNVGGQACGRGSQGKGALGASGWLLAQALERLEAPAPYASRQPAAGAQAAQNAAQRRNWLCFRAPGRAGERPGRPGQLPIAAGNCNHRRRACERRRYASQARAHLRLLQRARHRYEVVAGGADGVGVRPRELGARVQLGGLVVLARGQLDHCGTLIGVEQGRRARGARS